MYPSGISSYTTFIPTTEIAAKQRCRAYMVFKYFIDKKVTDLGVNEREVFMFEPATNAAGTSGHVQPRRSPSTWMSLSSSLATSTSA